MTGWLERPSIGRWLWAGMVALLVLSLVAELFIDMHGAFGVSASFGFHAWFGLLSCVALIVAARLLGVFLKRSERYYADE